MPTSCCTNFFNKNNDLFGTKNLLHLKKIFFKKMNAINKLFNSLNEFIKADVNVRTTNLSNELFETFKLIENSTYISNKSKCTHFLGTKRKVAGDLMRYSDSLNMEEREVSGKK